jgi:hypothetical protein
MPENKKEDSSKTLSMQQKRLQRFYYDTSDVEEIFNIQVEENTKYSKKMKKKSVQPTKK